MVQFTQTISAFPEVGKNYHDRKKSEGYNWGPCLLCTVFRMRNGKGKVKKEAKHLMSLVWQNRLKYCSFSVSFSHVFGDCWSSPKPAVWHNWECANLQTESTCNFLLVFNIHVFNSSFVVTKNIKLYSHFLFGREGKRVEGDMFSVFSKHLVF